MIMIMIMIIIIMIIILIIVTRFQPTGFSKRGCMAAAMHT